MNIAELSNVSKVYKKKRAVSHLNMTVEKGDIFGFIGRNGAGKSTTLKMICGLAAPSEGEIRLFGKPVTNDTARRRTGMLIENAGIYPGFCAKENLMLKARCLGIVDAEQRVKELLSFTGLEDAGSKKTKQFSMGMKQRLGIAMALLGTPDLLILDEPINGLDPEGIQEIRRMLLHLNEEQDITIIISSHILGELSKIATRYGIIKNGQMIQQIRSEELEQKCQSCLVAKVEDAKAASVLLEEKMNLTDYEVRPDGEIRIYAPCEPQFLNSVFAENQVAVGEVYYRHQDLESYFLKLMGGDDND